MQIILAGYNLDTEIIRLLAEGKDLPLTPETLSAAYARISRDPRPVNELRALARSEVEKARRSNQNIIFNMGHHSVAEHAVFNFDVIGISRLACEALEGFRLCSFTEKSQRYITLSRDFLVPEEIKQAGFEKAFVSVVAKQNELYEKMFGRLKEYVLANNQELAANPKNNNLLEGWAKEDARYISSLATLSQLGLTANARNLELMFRRFASGDLKELKELGQQMFALIEKVAPSVILFVEANPLDEKTYLELGRVAEKFLKRKNFSAPSVEIVDYTRFGDEKILAALLGRVSGASFGFCFEKVKKFSVARKREIFKTTCEHLEFYDVLPREFEFAEITFELIVSAACFAQLKRHRLVSISASDYEPGPGIVIPESVIKTGFEKEFRNIVRQSENLYFKMKPKIGRAAQYILTNAHQRRVLLKTNIRELYHISRLREDIHAQWDIRNITRKMTEAAQKIFPITLQLIGGKDKYPQIYKKVFGKEPKMMPPLI
jgi:flavin-dependent thymidylate synthase